MNKYMLKSTISNSTDPFTLLIISVFFIQLVVAGLLFLDNNLSVWVLGLSILNILSAFYLFWNRKRVVLLINKKYSSSEVYIEAAKSFFDMFDNNLILKLKLIFLKTKNNLQKK